MSQDVIELLKRHIVATNVTLEFPRASEEAIQLAEAALGFPIPTLLKSIYLDIADGGFGPGYGILGLSMHPDRPTLMDNYREIKKGATYLHLEWKTGLLPFCEWGCNIFSCVDCNDEAYPIFWSEVCHVRPQGFTLEDFFKMWIDGVDIWTLGKTVEKPKEGINPFTRKPIILNPPRKNVD